MTLRPMTLGSVRFETLAGERQSPTVLSDGADDVVGGPRGDLGLDFEGDGDLGAEDSGEVGDDLLVDASGVPRCVRGECRQG
jgi:hypothetical protein